MYRVWYRACTRCVPGMYRVCTGGNVAHLGSQGPKEEEDVAH